MTLILGNDWRKDLAAVRIEKLYVTVSIANKTFGSHGTS